MLKKKLLVLMIMGLFFLSCGRKEPYGIEFEEETVNFGTINEGEVKELIYVFKNTGTETLEIQEVRPTCGCTTTGDWDKVVEPGQTGKIFITFYSTDFQGEVTRLVSLKTNIPDKPIVQVLLTGTVIAPVMVTPPSVWLGEIEDADAVLSGSFQLKNNLDEPLIITEVISPSKTTTYTLTTLVPEEEYRLDFEVHPPFKREGVSVQKETFIVKLKDRLVEELYLDYSYFFKAALIVTPETISLGEVSDEKSLSGSYTIKNNLKTPLVIKEVLPEKGSSVELDMETVVQGEEYKLNFTLPGPFEQDRKEKIIIRTGGARDSEVVVSYYYSIQIPVSIYPLKVELDMGKLKIEPYERRINIKSNISKPIEVLDLKFDGKGMAHSVEVLHQDQYYQISLKFPRGFTFPEKQQVFYLSFRIRNDPANKRYEIPIQPRP